MNKDNFYINDLSEIRAFCINSDKEDVYKYIYSLQQENQASKQTINELTKQIAKLVEDKKQLNQRIDKAIEKLQLLIDIGFDYDGFNQVSSLKGLIDELVSYAIDSRDILKGDE